MSVGKFVRFCAATLGVMFVTGTAQAADLYGGGYGGYKDEPVYAPLPLWQGFYIGGSAGWAWTSVDAANNAILLGSSGSIPFNSLSASSVFGGGQLGYNVQAGNFVYGVEIDLGGLDTGTSGNFIDPTNSKRILRVSSGSGFYGDVTGRAGLTLGNALIYAKGGFAFFTGDVHVSDAYDGIYQDSGTFTGWTVGGGVEYLLTPNWTVKAEYLYFDFDNSNFSCCLVSSSGRLDNNLTANTVKVGFNYLVHSLRSPLN
ncbi:MAG: outer membrane protein [Rhodomicrobium sp.]